MVIAWSENRIDPAIIFSAAPGGLFLIRNVAALVPSYEADRHPDGIAAARPTEFVVGWQGVRGD